MKLQSKEGSCQNIRILIDNLYPYKTLPDVTQEELSTPLKLPDFSLPEPELGEKSSSSSSLSSSSSSSSSRSSCSTSDMNSRNIEPEHEDLDMRIKRDFAHLMDDQDETSGQTTPERGAQITWKFHQTKVLDVYLAP